jgi:hypothetical protein
VPQDALKSYTDEVIAVLKTDVKNDKEKREEIATLLVGVSEEVFNQLLALSKQVNKMANNWY